MNPESPAATDGVCPRCGLPRADLTAACPVCALAGPAAPPAAEAPAAEVPSPPAPAAPPPVDPAWTRLRLVALLLAVAVVSGGLGWWGGRATAPKPHPASEAPAAAPPVTAPPDDPAARPTAPSPRPPVPREPPPAERSASAGLGLVLIRPGTFRMGSWDQEPGRLTEEAEHPVRITRPFYLGTHEVTQGEYHRVTGENPSRFGPAGGGVGVRYGASDADRLPVERVTWFDAAAFCNALSKADGYAPYYELDVVGTEGGSVVAARVQVRGGPGYRLPTEAEWEYACRAGTKTTFHFGARNTGAESNVKAAVVSGGYGTAWPEVGRTTPVGSYPPNRWGLYDMHGNVAEWCQDWYERGYYRRSPDADPAGPDEGSQKVQRGGSWLVGEAAARSACRFPAGPGSATSHGGFRVARTP